MAYYQYNEYSNELVQISDFILAPDDHLPVSFVEISKQDLINLYQWDKSSLSFITKVTRNLSKKDFLKRFSPTEYSNIKLEASTNGVIDYYWQLFMIAESIELDDTDTVSGINILEQLGLLNPGRALEILS